MVVHCPNCGREIFSDPDYCVMCGWRRGQPTGRVAKEGRDFRRVPQPSRPQGQYRRERSDGRYREAPVRRRPSPPRNQGPVNRPNAQYRRRDDRARYRERPGGERQMGRDYPDRNREAQDDRYPRPEPRPQYDGRRERPYPERYERPPPVRRYRPEREPTPTQQRTGYGSEERNFCPNCQSELYTDPDNCVLCGWSRSLNQGPTRPDYQRRPDYQERPRVVRPEETRSVPPRDWERRIDDKMRGRAPTREQDKGWYRPKPERRDIEKKESLDRFVCENCGNPSLQFFADGLGRCPGCGHRFRYSSRPASLRSKQKHKQFVCSKCDSKNLQFFLNGTGLCPHCRREFKWRK